MDRACLRRGLPVRLVAPMHDTITDMIERHYSAHFEDAPSDVMMLAVIRLGVSNQTNTTPIGELPNALATSASA